MDKSDCNTGRPILYIFFSSLVDRGTILFDKTRIEADRYYGI